MTLLPDDKKQVVREAIKDIVGRGGGKVWVNESEGVFEYPYQTFAVVLRRKE